MEHTIAVTGPGQVELLPAGEAKTPGPREVAGHTLASLVSAGTELNYFYIPGKPGAPGYAAVFEVEEVGSEVSSVRPGDRVLCMGQHSSHQCVPETALARVPAGLDPAAATFARLIGVSTSTLTTTAARPPDRVVIMGLGLVGHLAAQLFSSCGYRVLACDPVAIRRQWAEEKGIRTAATPPVGDPEFAGQVALVVECSGREDPVFAGCELVRKKGEIVLIGTPWKRTSDAPAYELLHAIFHKYVVLRSGWEWELPLHPADFRTGSIWGSLAGALEWLGSDRLNVEGLFSLADPARCQETYQNLLQGRVDRLGAVFHWR